MKFYKDPFDSSILDNDVYKLILDQTKDVERAGQEVERVTHGLIFGFAHVEAQNIRFFESHQFHLISLRSSFEYIQRSDENVLPPDGFSVTAFTKDQTIQTEDIKKLALTIGEVNRYFKDKDIPMEKSLEIYMQWINNSLYHGFATRCFIARNNDQSIGICTVRVKEKSGEIDLFGIVPEYQNRKIGKYMLQQALDYLRSKHVGTISVVTAGENTKANSFFERNNFVLQRLDLVYHKHII